MSKIESAVRLALDFNRALNQHNGLAIAQLFSEDCIIESFHPAPNGAKYHGKSEVVAYWNDFFARFPKAQAEIEDVFGLGKRCVSHWKLFWEAADGTNAHTRGVDIFRTRDSLIVELLSYGKTLPAAR
jgi:predicted SnoaL-like aldol condensation-catalyzing enzyme